MNNPLTRLLVNLMSLAILVAILASPLILASNSIGEGAPWVLSTSLNQSTAVSVEIKNAYKGNQEIVLDFKPNSFSAEYKNVLTIFNTADSSIQIAIEKADETNARLNFESGEKVAILRPGEKKSIDLNLEAGATSSKSTARFIFKSI